MAEPKEAQPVLKMLYRLLVKGLNVSGKKKMVEFYHQNGGIYPFLSAAFFMRKMALNIVPEQKD